jgi:hypothetical protein
MEMNRTEQNYKIAERAEEAIKKHGTIEKAIDYLKSELKSFEDSWSSFSSDCLGHGITCNRLLISWLERKRSNVLQYKIIMKPLTLNFPLVESGINYENK